MTKRNPAGLWTLALRRLRADRVAMASLAVLALFLALLALSSLGLVAAGWEEEVAVSYAPPSLLGPDAPVHDGAVAARAAPPPNAFDPLAADIAALVSERGEAIAAPAPARLATLPFGADKWGHDILLKTIKGGETSIVVGLAAALLAVALGTLFGAVSGYFGGVVDDLFNWFYSVFTAIPAILMILAVAAVLQHKGVATIVLILGLTGWTGPYRLMRAEYMKHKGREYVLAADAIGASHWRKMFSHIFPNVSHVALVQLSILAVGFIKAEVILSFLGFGVPVGVVSWGSMLNEAQNELILGKWWQLGAAASAMALLVTAFSLFTDALRDALDPKLK
ncbi:ABC transporter permease [Massilia atriviolacea]|uniref:ABC transporter permease n=1 Tax=Massilia atriviolacea TaxID=2495579 RepID=A0A430HDN0_9BURK|nr:ABC transporter permease [Massilia atriviolacea]RSZ55623.1 ABC transporter permease [Massilia atriviolacea]